MTPDAKLSAAERAALAHLEARTAAEDPHFAIRLRGARQGRSVAAALAPLRQVWAALEGAGWWGVPAVVVGLVLMAAGLTIGLAVSVVGVALCVMGIWMMAGLVRARLARSQPPR